MDYSFPHEYLTKEVSPKTLARKKADGICRHYGCANPVRTASHTDCNTCSSRKSRLNNPVAYAYTKVKRSAEMRGHEFKLTIAEFEKFNQDTGYVERMGRGPDNLTIDRIDSNKGYEAGNIRALTYEDNVARRLEQMEFPEDPIAKALWEKSGCDGNWRAFRKQAAEVYDLVCRLQKYEEPEPYDRSDDPF